VIVYEHLDIDCQPNNASTFPYRKQLILIELSFLKNNQIHE